MRRTYKIAVVIFAILVAFGALGIYTANYFRNLYQNVPQPNQTGTGQVSLSASVTQSSVFDYNNTNNFLVYSLVSYSVANATNVNASLDVYTKNPMGRIYLVNVTRFCVSCFDENALRDSLRAYLSFYNLIKNGTSFSYVSIENVSRIPANSTVIIPSGLIPVSLLNNTGTGMISLLRKGDTVVYVGLNFSKSIGPNGLIFVNHPDTLLQLNRSGLDTLALSSSIASQSRANLSFTKPTFVFSIGSRYENITYARSGNGTLIAFSNYPKSSWNSSDAMAGDIAKAINLRFWMQRIGHYRNIINTVSNESRAIGVFAGTPSQKNLTKNEISINNTYSLVVLSAGNQKNAANVELSFRNAYKAKGSLGVLPLIGETQNIPILIKVSSTSPNTLFHLQIYNSNMSYAGAIPIGFISNAFGVVKYYAFMLPSGYYVLSLKDFNNNNFAYSLFQLENATIMPMSLDFKNGTFDFSVYSNGAAVNNATYTADLNGVYESNGSINGGRLSYTLPRGTIINYGNESFHFNMFNTNYTYTTSYVQRVLNIQPVYIEFAIAVAVVVLLNLVLKPPNREEYYIDVPEFPPSKREQMKVKEGEVLSVFDKVNYYYHWKYMPLTADEVRSGIGNNIRINSMPISITTQNANTILFTLLDREKVENASGYYAPSAWVEASGHSIEYLAVFRKLRDYCVSHAMLFTDLDASSGADMFITKNAKQVSVFLYTSSSQMKKITLSRDSRVALVFLNEEVMRDFFDKLYSSFGKDVEMLKLGIEYNYVKLLDSDHLDRLSF